MKPSEQVRICLFTPLIFLFPSNPRSPFCGADTTLCESMIPVDGSLAWPCARPGSSGWTLPPKFHRRETDRTTISPFPRGRNPWGDTARGSQSSPERNRHCPQIHRQSGVSRENHLDRLPFRVGKIAGVAAVVIFVLFALSRCPHRWILPSASTKPEEIQSKGLSEPIALEAYE